MYPSEFGSDAPGYEAVEPDVLFSLTPTLMALFALALLAAVVVGWLAGRQNPERASDGARRIYEEIEDSVKDAVKAPQRQVADRAAKLHAAIRENLGPVLTLSGGLSGPYDALGDLLDGRKPDHGGRDHKDDHPDHEEHDEDKASPLKSLINVVINHGDDHDHGRHPGKGHDHHDQPVSAGEQTRRLRAAVHAIADHWAEREARLAELRAARDALNRAGLSKSWRAR